MVTAFDSVAICVDALSRSHLDQIFVRIIAWPLWSSL